MDGDPVDGEPSRNNNGGNGNDSAPTTFTEVFMKVFPSYMVMGMTYEQFWNGPAWLTLAYREAYETKNRNDEWARWRQGAYFYDALLRVAPVMRAAFGKSNAKPGEYPSSPWPLTEKEAQEREARERQQRFERFMAALNKESEETIKKQREQESAKDDTTIKGASEDGGDRESIHSDQRE